MRVAIFEKHLDDLTQINLQLIKAFRLRVSAWPPRHVSQIEKGRRESAALAVGGRN